MFILEGLVDLHRTIQLQLLQHYWLVHSLDNCDIEWFALETNRDHSVISEIASKYCISNSFVEHDGYWRREWQATSVFLPSEPHEQYEKAK